MNQTELAKKAGITDAMLSYILNGERSPSAKIAKRLAEITDTPWWFWIDGKPEELKEVVKNAKSWT